jgi:Ca-activated chloride channel family protein
VDEQPGAAESDKKFGLRTMKSLRKTLCFGGAMLLVTFSTHVAGQSPGQGAAPAAQEQNPQARSQQTGVTKIIIPVNQVIVPVIVKDGRGRLVPDLRKEDFRIFEDNIEQRIGYFSAEAFPLSLVVLVDNDLKSKEAKQVAGSLRAIIAGLSASDEAFVCRFDQFFHPGKGFTSDQDKLLAELKRTELDSQPPVGPPNQAINNGPSINGHSAIGDQPNIAPATINIKGQATKALDDAVYAAAQLLRDRDPERQRRKIILLISDGVNAPKFNTNSYDTVRKDLLRYNIAVYGVGVGSAFFERRFERLSKYSHDTGGDVYYGLKTRSIEELYSRVTEEARNQYTLGYVATGTNRGAEYHFIEVKVEREGLTILAREGYYAGATPK